MIGRRPRHLSQRNYLLVAQIRENAARMRQVESGLGYRQHAMEQRRRLLGEATDAPRPLHIGPQLDMVRRGNGFEAA